MCVYAHMWFRKSNRVCPTPWQPLPPQTWVRLRWSIPRSWRRSRRWWGLPRTTVWVRRTRMSWTKGKRKSGGRSWTRSSPRRSAEMRPRWQRWPPSIQDGWVVCRRKDVLGWVKIWHLSSVFISFVCRDKELAVMGFQQKGSSQKKNFCFTFRYSGKLHPMYLTQIFLVILFFLKPLQFWELKPSCWSLHIPWK